MTTDTSALATDLATALGAFFAAELALAAALGFVLYAIAWLIGATLPAPQLPRLEASLNATTVIVPTSTRSAARAWMMKAAAKIGVAGTPAQRASRATRAGWTARAITGSRCVRALAFFLPACILRRLVPFVECRDDRNTVVRSADGAVLAVFIVDDTGIDPALLRELYTIAPTNPAAAAYG
jgi:hypothetical protein